jgi:tetratricopeptide (TPR) repeat protein
MTTAFLMLILILPASSPEDLEREGRLWEAGAAYQESGDAAGRMRITCRLLENALYAGHPFRSARLVEELEEMGAGAAELGIWRARLARVCGLERLAAERLQELSGPGWAGRRAAGLRLLYMGRPDDAVEELAAAYAAADTHMERYYAALDMTFAMLAAGRTERALQAADSLCAAMPGDGLCAVLRCLCLQAAGRYAEAMTGLDSLASAPGTPAGPASMAAGLLGELQ